MKTTIKVENLDVEKEEFDKINLKLEKILRFEPNQTIKNLSKKMQWPINQRDVFIKGSKVNNHLSYRVEYYHKSKEGKKCYLGCMDYSIIIKDNSQKPFIP